jgi:hypothetical protein
MRPLAIAGLACCVASLAVVTGCRRTSAIPRLRDAIAKGSSPGAPAEIAEASEGAPACSAEVGAPAPYACLVGIATWLGSTLGFRYDPPDQAGAATAALVLVRDGRGEWLPESPTWLEVVATGKGDGADALRLAMGARIAAAAPSFGRALEGDDDARAIMRAVASSVPGACAVYAMLGAGGDMNAGRPEARVDHAVCVQRDLDRPTGPREHGRYGSGLWRGAEGALALWKAAAAALRGGLANTGAALEPVLGAEVDTIDAALAKTAPKHLASPPDYAMYANAGHGVAGGDASDAGSVAARPVGAPDADAGRRK